MFERTDNYSQRIITIFLKFSLGIIIGFSFTSIPDFKQCPGLESLSFINYAMDIGALFSGFIVGMAVIILVARGQWKATKLYILLLAFYSIMIFSSLFHGASIMNRGVIANIFLVALFDICLYLNEKTIFKSTLFCLNIICLINLIFIFVYHPNGGMAYVRATDDWHFWTNSSQYLLGVDNGHIVTLLPVICFDLAEYVRKRKIIYVLLPILFGAGIFITFSVTTVAIVLCTVFLYCLYRRNPRICNFGANGYVFIGILLWTFTFFILLDGYKLFSPVFNYLFGKDIVDSGRARLYPIAYAFIKKKWLFGYGYLYNGKWIGGYNSPHNIILNILLSGGFVSLILYFGIIVLTLARGRYQIKKSRGDKCCILIVCAIESYVFFSIIEGYDTYISFYLFWWMCLAISQWDKFQRLL